MAKLFGVSKSLIRFWETEFDHLKPHKDSKGERRFTPKNIAQFNEIYELVKGRGFTLAGAKQELEAAKARKKVRAAQVKQLQELKGFLEELRDSL